MILPPPISDGNIVPASHYGIRGNYPFEMLITVTLEEDDGRTRLTLKHAGFPSDEDRDSAGAGWNGSFDKLAEYLAKEWEGAAGRTHLEFRFMK